MIPISVAPPPVSPSQKTYLDATAAVAATSITVESNTLFEANDFIVVGKIGADRSEIRKVSTTSGTGTVTLSAGLVFDHPVNDPVQIIAYDKIKIFSSTSEDGTYAEISGSPFAIAIEQNGTVIMDDLGTAATWYKIQYFNSYDSSVSSESDAIQGGGAKRNSVRELIDMVRFHMDLTDNNVVTDDKIISLFNESVDDLERTEGYRGQESEDLIDSVANENEYEMPEDMISLRSLHLTRSGTQDSFPTETDISELEHTAWGTTTSDIPSEWSTWGNRLVFSQRFTDALTKIKIKYYARIPYVDSDNDIIDAENHRIFVAYACKMIAMSMVNKDKTAFWTSEYANCKLQLVRGFRHVRSRTGFVKTKIQGGSDTRFNMRDIRIS